MREGEQGSRKSFQQRELKCFVCLTRIAHDDGEELLLRRDSTRLGDGPVELRLALRLLHAQRLAQLNRVPAILDRARLRGVARHHVGHDSESREVDRLAAALLRLAVLHLVRGLTSRLLLRSLRLGVERHEEEGKKN